MRFDPVYLHTRATLARALRRLLRFDPKYSHTCSPMRLDPECPQDWWHEVCEVDNSNKEQIRVYEGHGCDQVLH